MWTIAYTDGNGELVWPTVLKTDGFLSTDTQEDGGERRGESELRKCNLIHK